MLGCAETLVLVAAREGYCVQATVRICGAEETAAGPATRAMVSALPIAVAPASDLTRTFLNMTFLFCEQPKRSWPTSQGTGTTGTPETFRNCKVDFTNESGHSLPSMAP